MTAGSGGAARLSSFAFPYRVYYHRSLSLLCRARKRGLIEQDVAPFVIGFNLLNTLFAAFSLSSPPALNDSASSFHLSNRRQEFFFFHSLEEKEGAAAAGIESDRKNEKSGGGNFDGLFINFYVDFCFCC